MHVRYGKVLAKHDPSASTTVYGYITDDTLREVFATNPHASGVSEALAGTVHHSRHIKEITRAEFNAAFLNVGVDELEDGEAEAALEELRAKYAEL